VLPDDDACPVAIRTFFETVVDILARAALQLGSLER
jgi:hypothetical protein